MSQEATIKLSVALQGIARSLDQQIEAATGERIPFTLMVFTEGRASYVSTCERQDSIRDMRERSGIREPDRVSRNTPSAGGWSPDKLT